MQDTAPSVKLHIVPVKPFCFKCLHLLDKKVFALKGIKMKTEYAVKTTHRIQMIPQDEIVILSYDKKSKEIYITQQVRHLFKTRIENQFIIPVSDVDKIDIFREEEVHHRNGIARAAAGGAFFGTAGAIVGALTSDKFKNKWFFSIILKSGEELRFVDFMNSGNDESYISKKIKNQILKGMASNETFI